MRLIPVIDLKDGQVVRGIAGRRDQYRPIVSSLCGDSSPASVGSAFFNLGFDEAYLADLDAISGAEPDWGTYKNLLGCGLRLLVDAGVGTRSRAQAMATFESGGRTLTGVIVGLESVMDTHELSAAIDTITPERAIFSLDLLEGKPVARLSKWQAASPESIASEVIAWGVRRLIVLDVAGVGVQGGVSTLPLCEALRTIDADLEIISGGGVRHLGDLEQMARAGCDAALVASALHDGRISAHELRHFRVT